MSDDEHFDEHFDGNKRDVVKHLPYNLRRRGNPPEEADEIVLRDVVVSEEKEPSQDSIDDDPENSIPLGLEFYQETDIRNIIGTDIDQLGGLQTILTEKLKNLERDNRGYFEFPVKKFWTHCNYYATRDKREYMRQCRGELQSLHDILMSRGFQIIKSYDSVDDNILYYLLNTRTTPNKIAGKVRWTITCKYESSLYNGDDVDKQIPCCHIGWVSVYENGMKFATVMERIAMFDCYLYTGLPIAAKENATNNSYSSRDYNNKDLLFFPLEPAFNVMISEEDCASSVQSEGSSQDTLSQTSYLSQSASDKSGDSFSGFESAHAVASQKSCGGILSLEKRRYVYNFYSLLFRPIVLKHNGDSESNNLIKMYDDAGLNKESALEAVKPRKSLKKLTPNQIIYKNFKKEIDEIVNDEKQIREIWDIILKRHELDESCFDDFKDEVGKFLKVITDFETLKQTLTTSYGLRLHYEIVDDMHVCQILDLLDRDRTFWEEGTQETYFDCFIRDVEGRMERVLGEQHLVASASASASATSLGGRIIKTHKRRGVKSKKNKKSNKTRKKRKTRKTRK